jgi:MFS superfamily sulfate permease-like transporter
MLGWLIDCADMFTAVSLDEEIDTNKELVGHGYSNLLAGFLGTV